MTSLTASESSPEDEANRSVLLTDIEKDSTDPAIVKVGLVSHEPSEPQTNISDPPDDLEKQQDDAAVAETTIAVNDEDLVDWDGPNDPKKPMNWKNSRKAKNIIVICYCTFLTFASSPSSTPLAPMLTLLDPCDQPSLHRPLARSWRPIIPATPNSHHLSCPHLF